MLTTGSLLFFSTFFLTLMCSGGVLVLRGHRRNERFAERVRIIHGHRPVRPSDESAALRAALIRTIATFGQMLLRSGIIPARTRADLEATLVSSGLRAQNGVGVFIGCKILSLILLPLLAWLATRNLGLSSMVHMLLPPAAGVIGLVVPDWLIGQMRKRHQARLEAGLPDALDMMVICSQAGLGLGATIVRVATELQASYTELAMEFATTATELQIMSDSRIALGNLGDRTGLESFKRLAITLSQAIQYGTPLSEALRALSAELRQEMLVKFEETAARLPVILTLPMIIFILPCVFMIAGGPAIIQIMKVFSK
ncbi:MAG TPA: type II secretion system F family protein [Acetobacteraceae bacterium]|nr:type II secretion system F family protein [Acetobacteraceae bacterium]